LIDKVEDILEQAVSVHTCCSLLASACQHGTYDHYALRKCLNLLLMDFQEVTRTPGFLTLDYDVLEAVVGSDELNAPEEVIFEACMRWIAADEARPQAHLDDLLELALPAAGSEVRLVPRRPPARVAVSSPPQAHARRA